MIFPEFLKKGDLIAIPAPSDGMSRELDIVRLDSAEKALEDAGYRVLECETVRNSENGRSADALTRAKDINDLIKNKDCKYILCASGGDWMVEIVDKIDFDALRENPKWIEGMSDPTNLTFLAPILSDVATIYSSNAGEFGMKPWHEGLKRNLQILEGDITMDQKSFDKYQSGWLEKITGLESYNIDANVQWRAVMAKDDKKPDQAKEITIKGRMLGGCFDVITGFVGTEYDKVREFNEKYKEDGTLWYLENFALQPVSFYVALWQMEKAGWFDTATGFVFGRSSAILNEFSVEEYEEIMRNVLGHHNVPILSDLDIGHKPPHLTVINGAVGTIKYKEGAGSLSFEI